MIQDRGAALFIDDDWADKQPWLITGEERPKLKVIHKAQKAFNRKEIGTLYKSGQTIEQIADQYGVSAGCVRNCLVKLRIPRRTSKDYSRHKKNRLMMTPKSLRNLYENKGLTLQQIADRVGVNYSTVSHWLDQAGIPKRKKGWPKGRNRK